MLTEGPQQAFLALGNNDELPRNMSWVCGGVSKQAKLKHTKVGSGDTPLVDGSSKLFRTLDGFGYANWVKFKELSYGDSYSYRIWNDDHSPDWYSFITQPDSTSHFSFILVGDMQDILRGKAHGFMENVCHRYPQTDFYMSAGDFVEHPMNYYWDEAYQSVDSIVPIEPVLISPGNHGYVKGLVHVLEKQFVYVFSYLLESGYKDNNVYSIDCNDATIITLGSNRDSWLLFSQREWLKRTPKALKKKRKIVMLHHSVYFIKGKTNNLAVHWIFGGLFREYEIGLAPQGCEHNYVRMTNKDDEGGMTAPLYLVSHASPKSYHLSFNDRHSRSRTNCRFYQHIDIAGDTFQTQAYLENDLLYNDVRIVKNASGTRVVDNARDIPEILEMPAKLGGRKAEEFKRNAEEWRNRSLAK